MTNQERESPATDAIVYSIRNDVQSTVAGGEAVIVDLRSDAYFTLSATATLVWEAVQAGDGLEGATARITEAFDVEPEQARRDAAAFIEDLVSNSLIEAKAG